jgi:YjbE family integral membrane protein
MEFLFQPEFWAAVVKIIMIDILLGGDNAVVIALACRRLPPKQRRLGILWGTAGAIALRVVLIFFALSLLTIPLLKLVGALLLLWIGIKLLLPEEEDKHSKIESSDRLWAAVKTVIAADLVMSLDNIIAIAGAAEGAGEEHKMILVIFGLSGEHSHHCLGQSTGGATDGPLSPHYHPGRHAAWLDCRRNGDHRPICGVLLCRPFRHGDHFESPLLRGGGVRSRAGADRWSHVQCSPGETLGVSLSKWYPTGY